MKTLIATLILFICLNTFGQNAHKVDQIELISNIQTWHKKDSKMKLAFWIPNSYWRIALEGNPEVKDESIKLLESIFENYVVMCFADVQIITGGGFTFTSKIDLKNTASIIDDKKNVYYPLQEKDFSIELNTILDNIRPMFAKMLGQLGEGMHFYLFEIKDKKGVNIINEFEKGNFTVKHSNDEFKWNLPLPALLPSKYCPTDNEIMKGNWSFCPIHGVKLSD